MQQHRIISIASILVMFLIPVIGWFLVAQPQLAAASAADQQRVAMQEQINASSAAVAELKNDSEHLADLNAELDELRTSIPAGVDPSGYIDGLDALARVNGVAITSLTVSDPMAYIPATPPVDPNAVASDSGGDSGEGDGETSPEAPAPPPVANPAIVTSPLIDSTNFVAIPVTIDVEGEWGKVLDFVNGLQSTDRLFLVTTMDLSQEDGGAVTASIGGFIYAIPTGVEGNPRPTSTIVKQMDAVDGGEEEAGDEAVTPDTPTPEPTSTPAA